MKNLTKKLENQSVYATMAIFVISMQCYRYGAFKAAVTVKYVILLHGNRHGIWTS